MGMLTKDNQIKVNIPKEDKSAYSQERYKFFLDAPFEISNRCCNVMKKSPAHSRKEYSITAQMAVESRLRTQKWLQNGCNGFDLERPISNPMSFWTNQDVLLYIRLNNLKIADVYGEVLIEGETQGQTHITDFLGLDLAELEEFDRPYLETTGCNRTGCIFCGFGLHLEKRPNRLELLEQLSNPKLLDYVLRGGAFDKDGLWKPDGRGLGYWFVIKWINVHGGFDVYIPHYEKYEQEYGNELTKEYLNE